MCDYCSWIDKILHPRVEDLPKVCTDILNEEKEVLSASKGPIKYDPTILVHGTADSDSSREDIIEELEKIEKAAVEAYKELAKGCGAVDAVELAISNLERTESNSDNDETGDASKKNNLPVIRDAAMMDNDSNAGSFGAATDALHPITLAKRIMQETDDIVVIETGARNIEISSSNPSQMDKFNDVLSPPPNSRNSKESGIAEPKTIQEIVAQKDIKVYGAVARDRKGRLVCGISTMDEREQSVARSSMTASGTVLGCGIFSNSESCCTVSSDDRAVYLYAPARKIVERLRENRGATKDANAPIQTEDALHDELANFIKDTEVSRIGAAALRVKGKPEVAFTSCYFPWAYCINGVVASGCIKGEVNEKDVGDLDMPLDCTCD